MLGGIMLFLKLCAMSMNKLSTSCQHTKLSTEEEKITLKNGPVYTGILFMDTSEQFSTNDNDRKKAQNLLLFIVLGRKWLLIEIE